MLSLRLVVGPLLCSDPSLLVSLAEWFLPAAALGFGLRNGADRFRNAAGAFTATPFGFLFRRHVRLLPACLFLGPPRGLFQRNGMDLLRRPT
jgi:hypothetical protein